MRTLLFAVVLLLLPVHAYAWPAKIVEVTDGDTLIVEPKNGGDRSIIRLWGIDAPERNQPGGEAARRFVFEFLFQTVVIEPLGKDRYGRLVAIVIMPGGESLQAILLQAGLAWVLPRYCKGCVAWQDLQDAARLARRGLWDEPEPVPPWAWRKGEREPSLDGAY